MVGFPGETSATMAQTFKFAQKLRCDSAQFYPLFVYPGTRAYAWAVENNYLKSTDFFQLADVHRISQLCPGSTGSVGCRNDRLLRKGL